jgi:hypothetical protein
VTGSLAGLPGRRAIVFVTEHLSTNPVQGLLEQWYINFSPLVPGLEQPSEAGRTWDMTQALRELADQRLRRPRDLLHPPRRRRRFGDMPGADVGNLPATSTASTNTYEREPLMPPGGDHRRLSMFNSANVRGLLDQVAPTIATTTRSATAAPKSQDGKYHRIEVKVPNHDVRLRHPSGYRAKTAEQRMQERTMSALMFDVAENPLDIKVQLMPEQARTSTGCCRCWCGCRSPNWS